MFWVESPAVNLLAYIFQHDNVVVVIEDRSVCVISQSNPFWSRKIETIPTRIGKGLNHGKPTITI